jgi:photosystem II stability/assembly factor-like uncharacterized protein
MARQFSALGTRLRAAHAATLAAALFSAGPPLVAQSPSVPVAQEFEALHFRSIGPAQMSGRIADLAVYEANPAIYYVGTAHGGVWKTTSNGVTFEALFQNEGLISIGDVTVSQRNPDLLWVGAGESNNRQSTSWGGGVYRTTDGGRTFQHMGLANSRHINRIAIHPANDDVVFVGATGPLFGPGGDRGLYKTTDGGRTWRRVLHVDDDTGVNDVVISDTDPRVMYASTYQRRRNACCMNGGGPGSGIWKSTDGGDTWTRLRGNGLPDGPLGRIALDAWRQDGNLVMALIEGPGGGGGGAQGGQQPAVTGVYRSRDGGASWERIAANNPRPMYFSKIRIDPSSSDRVYGGGVGLHMSIDGGVTWETDAAMAIHDDKHAIWINPSNPDHILIGNDGGLAVTYDRSRTWLFMPNLPVGLFYHVSYDMETPFNVCGGMQDNYNWCGPSRSRFTRGIMTSEWFQIQGGDGFHAIPDLRDPAIVYTESQNGNMIRRNTLTGESKSIRPTPQNVVNAQPNDAYRYNWDAPMMLSPHDPGVLIVAANRVFRSSDRGDSWTAISPDLTTNADRNDIATMGVANRDVRIARNDGISSWPTIVSLAESPRQAGIFWAGTDDGVVQVSRDNGANWENVTARLPGFPQGGWVSEVVPSRFDAGTVYITVDNHFQNDYESYVWASSDFGRTFRSIRGNLRGENVRTLTEDTRNADVLYIGTETGVFVSLDRGGSWRRLQSNLPTVRVDELTIHPRDNALIVASHGRALWILDDLAPIQEYTAAQRAQRATLFQPAPALLWKTWDNRNEEFWGHQFFMGENPPNDAVLQYHLPSAANEVRLVVSDAAGRRIRELNAPPAARAAGIRTLCWDMRVTPVATAGGGAGGGGGGGGGQAQQRPIEGVPQPLPAPGYRARNVCAGSPGSGGATAGPQVLPGVYTVALLVDGTEVGRRPLTVVLDPQVQARFASAEHQRWFAQAVELHELHGRAAAMVESLTSLGLGIAAARARVDSVPTVPSDVRNRLEALHTEFEQVRVKFGIPVPGAPQAAGGGPGGGGAAAQALAQQPMARFLAVKSSIVGLWETPSAAVQAQAATVVADLNQALGEAAALLARAPAVSQALEPHGITLAVPGR